MKKTENNETRRVLFTPAAGLCVRESGEGHESGRTIEGYAIRFDSPSAILYDDGKESFREVIERGSITRELLDRSDIKFTLFHDPHQLLARSKGGNGTLSYELREDGVYFSFEAPRTADGDKALELVRSGVIDGCSFAFTTRYRDNEYVSRTSTRTGGKVETVCHVRRITGIYDMTITPDPAYPTTSVAARDLSALFRDGASAEDPEVEAQVDEMRRELARPIF